MGLTERALKHVAALSSGALGGGSRLGVGVLREPLTTAGPQCVELGERIAVGGVLTPRVIGDAAGEYDEQALKRVWHCLARFGLAGWTDGAEDSGRSG